MKIALLGAPGIIGQDIAKRLAKEGHDDLLLADRREEAARNLANQLEAEFAAADVTDVAQTARILKGSDLVVNATLYYSNLQVMQACLNAGCDYLDLGGLYHTTRKQLALHDRFEEEGRLGILGCGKAPGITNVLAAWGAPRFDRLEAVRLRSGRKELGASEGIKFPYSPQTLFDELTLRPIVLKGGKLMEIEPLEQKESVRHPEPLGQIDYIATLHSELATLPGFLGKGLREMDFKVALAPGTTHALETLIRLGLASTSPVTIDGKQIAPRNATAATLAGLSPVSGPEAWITEVEMTGSAKGVPQTLQLRVTGNESQNGTAIGAVTGVQLMKKKLTTKRAGVFAPESVLPSKEFIRGLSDAGLRVTETSLERQELSA
jgi:saccharopine dehydrogenase-like NADP-dependent oxidoreductase